MATSKTTRWAFTAYEADYDVINALANKSCDIIAEIGWQDEVCPTTGRKHRQGYVRTVRQVRFAQLKAVMGGSHIEAARDWAALLEYCRKKETRDASGSQVSIKFEPPMRLHEMLIEVASMYLLEHRNNSMGLDRQTDRHLLLTVLRDYSQSLVSYKPEYALVLCRADAKDAWTNYIEVWLAKAAATSGGDLGQ